MTDPADDREPDLPEALQRDLRAALGARVRIPAELDAQLVAAARDDAARRRRPRPAWLRPTLLAAAALLVLLPVTWLASGDATGGAAMVREDFDRNGRVDVLDAYRLSLALRRGDAVATTFDLDGDGRVDGGDVERIAARAVRVHG